MKIFNFRIIVILIAFGFFTEIFGQVGGPQGQMGPFKPPFERPMQRQIRRRIETIKIWKLTEELNLTEQQSERFFPVYNKFKDELKATETERRQVIEKLDELTTKDKPSADEINKLLDELEDLDRNINTAKEVFRGKLKDILTTQQIGRLYVFEVMFQRQIQEIVRDIRKKGERL
jgi:Spy/CpxP family protein refolding chaperone